MNNNHRRQQWTLLRCKHPVRWSHALGLELLPGGVAPALQGAAMLSQAAQLNKGRHR